jgi:hypothetical protein
MVFRVCIQTIRYVPRTVDVYRFHPRASIHSVGTFRGTSSKTRLVEHSAWLITACEKPRLRLHGRDGVPGNIRPRPHHPSHATPGKKGSLRMVFRVCIQTIRYVPRNVDVYRFHPRAGIHSVGTFRGTSSKTRLVEHSAWLITAYEKPRLRLHGRDGIPGNIRPRPHHPSHATPGKRFPSAWFFVYVFKPFGMYHEPVF